ncbi:T9SS type A sorting domain-containing protein [Brumimicrobium mesophilum]|uniref:T9SS type A sorting domain-containing protein n=1 Tax=Brumimicrobium mesophilum TaxID=392717 RepID=UPI000D144926|nr:T9SS type A sorting domain-containing protein [Brumimicrobium mesophilum]
MKLSLLLSTFFFIIFSNSQTLQITDQYVFGGDFGDFARDGVRLNNKSLIGGDSNSEISGDKTTIKYGSYDVWIVALDVNNSIEWQKSFGGSSVDFVSKLLTTSDGNLLIGVDSESDISGNKTVTSRGGVDFWVIKVDEQGNELWQKTYGGSGDDYLSDIVELSDGSFILAGSSDSPISGDKTEASLGQSDFWIVKIDHNGNVLWDKTFGGSAIDGANSIVLDDNIIVGGTSNSPISGNKSEGIYGGLDIWILKLDSSGALVWDKTLGGDQYESLSDLILLNNRIFAFGNSSSSISGSKTEESRGFDDYYITMLDYSGSILMDKTYGGNDLDQLTDVKLMASGDLVLAGISDSDVSGDVSIPSYSNSLDYWILILNPNDLSLKSQFKFGGGQQEYTPTIMEAENNSLLLFGASDSDISGDKTIASKGLSDFWILELSTDLSTLNVLKEESLSIYPNPTSNTFKISNLPAGEKLEISVVDMMGKTVINFTVSETNNSVDVNSLCPGMYTLQMYDGGKKYTSKLVVE